MKKIQTLAKLFPLLWEMLLFAPGVNFKTTLHSGSDGELSKAGLFNDCSALAYDDKLDLCIIFGAFFFKEELY